MSAAYTSYRLMLFLLMLIKNYHTNLKYSFLFPGLWMIMNKYYLPYLDKTNNSY